MLRMSKQFSKIPYYKMNGIGNKFVIYDLRNSSVLVEEFNRSLDNSKNIDFDQKIILLNSDKADILMQIYNSDGSVGAACGNAARCVAYLVNQEKNQQDISIETCNRILVAKKLTDSKYQVNMGKILLSWQHIPLTKECDAQNLPLLNEQKFTKGFALNIGNPHIVFFVQNIDDISLKNEVSFLETHDLFNEGVNINIAQILSQNEILLKTWERGAGSTLACGTGACATAYAAYHQNLTKNQSVVSMPGGMLNIDILDNQEILMSGETFLEESSNF